jgi:uncharacterized protein
MRALAWFLAAIFGTLVLAALLAWPTWLAVHPLEPDWPFHRVSSRLWQLLLLIGILVALRRMGLSGRGDWGFGLPRPAFLRQAAAGFATGIATMLPMSLAMLALGIVEPAGAGGAAAVLVAVASGALAGLLVALVEETFFRGLMYRSVERESGFALAAWSTALVYAAVHFLARTRIPDEEVAWDSGLRLLGGALARFAEPSTFVDSFATLLLVGLMLALVRRRTGAIAAGIGLHMGWVCVIKSTIDLTDAVPGSRWSFLVGSLDGYTGWLVAAWASILLAAAWSSGWLRPKSG